MKNVETVEQFKLSCQRGEKSCFEKNAFKFRNAKIK